MLRQSGIGVIIAAPTGVAAWNTNGITLHSCCLLPVVNKSYGKACDLPLPCGPQLAALQNIWNLVSVLFVDEMSFVSSYMLERLDQHLRLAKNAAYIPFGGVHLILSGDLYQLPPPGGLPPFAGRLWMLSTLRTQELHSMVLKPKDGKQPAAKAVYLYPTRRAVAESNSSYIEEHVRKTGAVSTSVLHWTPMSRPVQPVEARLVHIFADPAERFDWKPHLQMCMMKLEFIPVEIMDGDSFDSGCWDKLFELAKQPKTILLITPPYDTFSRARHRKPGPPPLRNQQWPRGFPWLKDTAMHKVQVANHFVDQCIRATTVAAEGATISCGKHRSILAACQTGTFRARSGLGTSFLIAYPA